MTGNRPLIGLVTDLKQLDAMPYHVMGGKYAAAIQTFAEGIPLGLVPTSNAEEVARIVDALDGFMFTGSASNIHPSNYASTELNPPFDVDRDEFALPLAAQVLRRRKPALFICRGFQELNVALGGSLFARLDDVGHAGHHAEGDLPYEQRYAPRHAVALEPGSPLEAVFGSCRFEVNSLHYQGLDRIGAGVTVHGRSADGLAEIIAVDDHPFAIGVQWHPEYCPELSAHNALLLRAFGNAARNAWAERAGLLARGVANEH